MIDNLVVQPHRAWSRFQLKDGRYVTLIHDLKREKNFLHFGRR